MSILFAMPESKIVRSIKTFRKDEVIITEGQPPGNEIYYLYKGRCIAESKGKVVGVIEPGEFIGEVSVILQSKTIATVRAVSDCILFCFSGLGDENLYELIQKDVTILRKLIQQLAIRLIETEKRYLTESDKTVKGLEVYRKAISGALYVIEKMKDRFKSKLIEELYEHLRFTSGIMTGDEQDLDDRYFPTSRFMLFTDQK